METHATTPVPAQTLQNVSPPWKRHVQRGFSELPKVVLMSIRIGTPVFKDATDALSHFVFGQVLLSLAKHDLLTR